MSVRAPSLVRNAAQRPRRPAATGQRARARRRRLIGLGVVAATVVAIVALLPTLNHAVRTIVLPLEHADIIRQQARAKHLDPALIAAVIYAESKFVARTSPAGATGLMQITPETAAFIARRSGATRFAARDLATPQVNIAYGSYYLRYLLDRYRGNLVEALAAYNGGISNVDGWVALTRRDGASFGVDRIAFPETRAYVRKVVAARSDYRASYARELGL